MFKICNACLAYNVKMFCIENSELLEIYDKLNPSTKLKTTVAEITTICYICYSQIQRSLKFSKLALKSQKILKSLVDSGDKISKNSILRLNLGTIHDLSITNVPPISINVNTYAKNKQATIVKEEIIDIEDSAFADDKKPNACLSNLCTTFPNPIANLNGSVRKQMKQKPHKNQKQRVKRVQNKTSKSQASKNPPQIIQDNKDMKQKQNLRTINVKQKAKTLKGSKAVKLIKDSTRIKIKLQTVKTNNGASLDLASQQANTKSFSNGMENLDMNTLSVVQREAKINETIQKLVGLIEKNKPSVISTYNLQCQIVRESKNAKRLPKKRFNWCNHTRFLLTMLLKLAGSEKAGIKLLKNRVSPLFPRGFARMPTLLKMAGYRSTNVRKLETMQSQTQPYQIEIPSASIFVAASPAKDKALQLPYITNTFSLNKELKMEIME